MSSFTFQKAHADKNVQGILNEIKIGDTDQIEAYCSRWESLNVEEIEINNIKRIQENYRNKHPKIMSTFIIEKSDEFMKCRFIRSIQRSCFKTLSLRYF